MAKIELTVEDATLMEAMRLYKEQLEQKKALMAGLLTSVANLLPIVAGTISPVPSSDAALGALIDQLVSSLGERDAFHAVLNAVEKSLTPAEMALVLEIVSRSRPSPPPEEPEAKSA